MGVSLLIQQRSGVTILVRDPFMIILQGLPSGFCKAHLPKKDETIVLENEKGEEWDTVYLANKTGLSGGWRGFSLDHGLVDGDALVFELVQHCRFKVRKVQNHCIGVCGH
jgi:hypothetical protein